MFKVERERNSRCPAKEAWEAFIDADQHGGKDEGCTFSFKVGSREKGTGVNTV